MTARIFVVWRIYHVANIPIHFGTLANVCPTFTLEFSDLHAQFTRCVANLPRGESTMWRIYHVANLPCGKSPMWQILWQPTGLGLIGMVVFLDCALCNFFVHLLCRCALAPDQYFLTVLSAVCKLFVRLLCCCALALNQSK